MSRRVGKRNVNQLKHKVGSEAAEVQKCKACESKAGMKEAFCTNISLAKLAFIRIIGTSNKLLLIFRLNFHFVNYFI